MRRPLLAAALLAAAALPLHAQPSVAPGARVRLDAPGLGGVFHLVSATPDTLVVRRDPAGPTQRVAVSAVRRLEVSQGRRSAGGGFGRGFAIGATAGALLGLASGFASGDDDPGGWFTMTAEEKAFGGALFLGAGGGVLGGVVGLVARPERWVRADAPPRVAVVTPPVGRGVGVRLAGAF